MKYKIYCLEAPDHLKSVEPDGYYMKTRYRHVLIDVDDEVDIFQTNEFDSMETALQFIEDNKEKLKGQKLTILPIVEVPY